MKPRIGFIGLGIMGRGMAANLLAAGYELTVYNRTRRKAEGLVPLGAKVADSPMEAAKDNDVVITILADPPAVAEAVLGPEGAVQGLKAGSVLIDCSTVDLDTTKLTGAAAAARGAEFLDCPVAGSKDAAAAGELILMIGGPEETVNRVRDIFDVVSIRMIHAGPSGSGTMVKLCFNLMVSHMAAALSEALILGTKAGLKPEVVLDTIMAGRVQSPFYEWKGGCMIDRDFATNFSTKLMHKDLGLIMSAGYSLNLPLPTTAAVKELFGTAKAQGLAEEDFCSVVKVLEQFAGIEVTRVQS